MKLRAKMMMISLLPVFLLGTGIFILAADRMANGIYQESYDGMHAAALAVRDIFEIGGEGAYRMDAGGDLWKGEALNISKSFGIVDHIKEMTGMDVTIFWGDARVLTSIHDEAGERQAGTTAPKEAKDSVLGRGEPLMTRDVEILGTEYVACYVPFFQDGDEGGDPAGMIFLGNPRERVSVIINEVRLQMLLAVLFVLAITGVVVTGLVNRVLGALFQGMGLLKKISEGDLRAPQADEQLLRRSDEIGLLGKEICMLRGRLLEMIGTLCEKSSRLDFEAQAMRQRSKNILLSMKGIDSSVQEMSESCAEQARDALSAGGRMTDMGEMIGGSNLEIHKMHEVSTQIQIVSERAMDKILELREEMKEVGTAIGYLGRQTRLTKESADKISSAAELIAAVASQTSLLSLNASIEAARAGEAGKGFGVVASEIQKLSVQADEAVEDIRSMTENLIQNSDHTMERMEEVKEIIGSQSQTAEQAGKAFESVWNRIQESAGCMNVVSKKAAEIEEVRMNIVSAAQNSAALSQENAAAIEEIMAALSESCEEIHILSEEADALEELSAQMKQIVGAFRN